MMSVLHALIIGSGMALVSYINAADSNVANRIVGTVVYDTYFYDTYNAEIIPKLGNITSDLMRDKFGYVSYQNPYQCMPVEYQQIPMPATDVRKLGDFVRKQLPKQEDKGTGITKPKKKYEKKGITQPKIERKEIIPKPELNVPLFYENPYPLMPVKTWQTYISLPSLIELKEGVAEEVTKEEQKRGRGRPRKVDVEPEEKREKPKIVQTVLPSENKCAKTATFYKYIGGKNFKRLYDWLRPDIDFREKSILANKFFNVLVGEFVKDSFGKARVKKNIESVEEFCKDLVEFPINTGFMVQLFAGFGRNKVFSDDYEEKRHALKQKRDLPLIMVKLLKNEMYDGVKESVSW